MPGLPSLRTSSRHVGKFPATCAGGAEPNFATGFVNRLFEGRTRQGRCRAIMLSGPQHGRHCVAER